MKSQGQEAKLLPSDLQIRAQDIGLTMFAGHVRAQGATLLQGRTPGHAACRSEHLLDCGCIELPLAVPQHLQLWRPGCACIHIWRPPAARKSFTLDCCDALILALRPPSGTSLSLANGIACAASDGSEACAMSVGKQYWVFSER